MKNIDNIFDYLEPFKKTNHDLDFSYLSVDEKIDKFVSLFNLNKAKIKYMFLYNKITLIELKNLKKKEDFKIFLNKKSEPNIYTLVSPKLIKEVVLETKILKKLDNILNITNDFNVLKEIDLILTALSEIKNNRTKKAKEDLIELDKLNPILRYNYSSINYSNEYLDNIYIYVLKKVKT